MPLKIASFNVNSIKMRLPNVINWIDQSEIDIILMQETKTIDENFPFKDFNEIGFDVIVSGQKSYNGVAILSKIPIINKSFEKWCGLDDTRHVCAVLENNVRIHNFYIPAGGDLPDIKVNEKSED